MREDVAKKWVAALRSGEYEQERGYLQTEHGHCCLGVLCDLHAKETGQGDWLPWGSGERGHTRCYRDESGVGGEYTPPLSVCEWADLEEEPCVRVKQPDGDVTADEIVNLNDQGYSFAQLADLIEEQWKSL